MKVLVSLRRIRQLEGMVATGRKIAGLLLLTLSTQLSAAGASSEWITATPEEVGLDSAALGEMMDYAREHEIPVHSVQIVRHGRLVFDAYLYPFNFDDTIDSKDQEARRSLSDSGCETLLQHGSHYV